MISFMLRKGSYGQNGVSVVVADGLMLKFDTKTSATNMTIRIK